jgi:hypothetical protein
METLYGKVGLRVVPGDGTAGGDRQDGPGGDRGLTAIPEILGLYRSWADGSGG